MSIQEQVWRGYAQAAAVLGRSYDLYRPNGPSNPLARENWLGPITAAFDDKPNFKFATPQLYGHPDKYVLIDGTLVLAGDYITLAQVISSVPVSDAATYFIADKPHLLPIVAIECNVVISITRPLGNVGFGAQPYGGSVNEAPVMTGWPASIDAGTKGEKGDTQLPGDIRMPWFRVLLPAWPGVVIQPTDIIADNLGRSYKISSTELTSLGWRLTAMLAET